jgi:hypothetical protein
MPLAITAHPFSRLAGGRHKEPLDLAKGRVRSVPLEVQRDLPTSAREDKGLVPVSLLSKPKLPVRPRIRIPNNFFVRL